MASLVRPGSRSAPLPDPARLPDHLPFVDGVRPSPLDWMRSRRIDRDTRRADAAHQRIAERMGELGRQWRVLDLQAAGCDRMRFLAVGPGGVFAVTVKDYGRARIGLTGDVVQVDGRRLTDVAQARHTASLAATALSRTARVPVPVTAVLAFAGSGAIAVHGPPKGIIVTSDRDLSLVLHASGRRLAPPTVDKLHAIAADPATWTNPVGDALAGGYTWYPNGTGATDRRADHHTTGGKPQR
jgi:hypothetical protein